MFKTGKRTKAWNTERAKLKKLYEQKGITSCELRLSPSCTGASYLSFAHRHKRHYYYSGDKSLSDFKQTVIACIACHQAIEYDKEKTERYFTLLRGAE